MRLHVQNVMLSLLACAAGSAAAQQTFHEVDYLLRIGADALEVGGVGVDGQPVYPQRVRSGVFGAEGFPNFTNDPGVDAELGELVPGMFVGFDLTAAVRAWDGDFDQISDDTITVRKSGINTVSPMSDMVVPGIVFGQANLDNGAGFHHHVQFLLDPALGGSPSGLWLLEWELWTDAPGVERSEPLYIVFAQGDGEDELDDAVQWVRDNLVSQPCVADIATPFGQLNFFDVSAYIGLYNSQDPSADLAAPFGTWNFFDISAFIAAYNAGCP
ncbi:MAG: GC-type dockerin domain-anchored protein [Phycisphaerales bacterium]